MERYGQGQAQTFDFYIYFTINLSCRCTYSFKKSPYIILSFIFFLCFVQNIIIPSDKNNINHSIRIRFVMYCSIHLTIIGVFALSTNYTLSEVLILNNIFLICTFITSILFSLLRLSKLIIKQNVGFDIKNGQTKEFQYLYNFLNINIIYIFIEAFLCEFTCTLTTNLSILLCSNILSVLLISCYIQSLLKILNENQAKKFNIELFKSLGDYNIKLNEMRAHVHYDTLTGARSRIFLIQESMRLLDNNILFSLAYIGLDDFTTIFSMADKDMYKMKKMHKQLNPNLIRAR